MKHLIFAICVLLWASLACAEARLRHPSTGLFNGNSCAPIATSVPTGAAATDFGLVWVEISPSTGSVTTPAGWTLVGGARNVGGGEASYLFSDSTGNAAVSFTTSGVSTCYYIRVALFDARQPSSAVLSIDGTQHGAGATASISTSLTPTALTASTTWDAGLAFTKWINSTPKLIPISHGWQPTYQCNNGANGYPCAGMLGNQSASGTFNFGSFLPTTGGSGVWIWDTVLITGALAPVHDYRLRGANVSNSTGGVNCGATTNPSNTGDLLVTTCDGLHSPAPTLGAPDGTWSVVGSDSGSATANKHEIWSKTSGGSGGTFTFTTDAGDCTCVVSAYYDVAGSSLAVHQSVFSHVDGSTTPAAPSITPAALNNVLDQIVWALASTDTYMTDPDAATNEASLADTVGTGPQAHNGSLMSTTTGSQAFDALNSGSTQNVETATLEINSTVTPQKGWVFSP